MSHTVVYTHALLLGVAKSSGAQLAGIGNAKIPK